MAPRAHTRSTDSTNPMTMFCRTGVGAIALAVAVLMVSACSQETTDTSIATQTPKASTTSSAPASTNKATTTKQAASTGLAFKTETMDMPGRPIWEANCKVCHGTGLAGAPLIGNLKSWEKRVARGKPSLYEHALNGWGDMPARGGNAALTDDQVKHAVNFMVAQVEP